jgi:hypothetical protein
MGYSGTTSAAASGENKTMMFLAVKRTIRSAVAAMSTAHRGSGICTFEATLLPTGKPYLNPRQDSDGKPGGYAVAEQPSSVVSHCGLLQKPFRTDALAEAVTKEINNGSS